MFAKILNKKAPVRKDEAVRIGPAPVGESYLRGERILAAAKATGAQAIHPGYGFLSENPDFAEAVAAAGLVFIGPSADSIRAMGLKDAAKALMEKAGVPVVPGYHGAEQEPAFLAERAAEIGFPVLIKARGILKMQEARANYYLKAGDVVETGIRSADGVIDLGVQRNRVVEQG